MFGLTKREQRWKAEQQAAEVIAILAAVAIRCVADARIAEAQTDASEDVPNILTDEAQLNRLMALAGAFRAANWRERDSAEKALESALREVI